MSWEIMKKIQTIRGSIFNQIKGSVEAHKHKLGAAEISVQ